MNSGGTSFLFPHDFVNLTLMAFQISRNRLIALTSGLVLGYTAYHLPHRPSRQPAIRASLAPPSSNIIEEAGIGKAEQQASRTSKMTVNHSFQVGQTSYQTFFFPAFTDSNHRLFLPCRSHVRAVSNPFQIPCMSWAASPKWRATSKISW